MLTHLSVRNYQSLDTLDIELSPFTVIVGPSSSGKSALTRALRTLTTNTRGSSFVSTWAKRSTIEAEFTDGSVTLTRGAKTADDSYVLHTPNLDTTEQTFTKLSGTTPEEVSEFLGIDPALTFADQFDRPFLLADSPAEVARTFAALTNVHTVFAAAREANRTRLERGTRLRIRTADLEAIKAQRDEFKALGDRLRAQALAEQRMEAAGALDADYRSVDQAAYALEAETLEIERTSRILANPVPSLGLAEVLAGQIHDLGREANRLSYWTGVLTTAEKALTRPVVSLEAAEQAHASLSVFKDALRRIKESRARVTETEQATHVYRIALTRAESEYTEALQALGHCPTCGQSTTHTEEKNHDH